MKYAAWLRTASVVSLLFAAGHTLGGMKDWSPIGESTVLAAMRAYRFEVEGVSRTYLDFYRGFGFSLSVFMLLEAVILWQLAATAARDASIARPMIAAFAVASIVTTAISCRFIMPVPAVFSAALTACLLIAFFTARTGQVAGGGFSR